VGKRLPQDVYADLIRAGFPPGAAITMTSIAAGESGYDPTALGDVSLQSGDWGPSFGLYQIRTLKSATGTGGPRDIQWLAASPDHQAQAAYAISQQGTTFTPWTVYRSGRWRDFLGAVVDAVKGAAGVAGATVSGSADGVLPTFGPGWLPWNWPSNFGNAALQKAASTLGGVRTVLIEVAAAGLGLLLVGLGLARAVQPVLRRTVARAGL
jgi:hypothetical protein